MCHPIVISKVLNLLHSPDMYVSTYTASGRTTDERDVHISQHAHVLHFGYGTERAQNSLTSRNSCIYLATATSSAPYIE